MPRSLVNGNYHLVIAIESASRANSWYRVLADRQTGQLSCDCPAWTFRQNGGITLRSCKHTQAAQLLVNAQGQVDIRRTGVLVERASGAAANTNLLVQSTQQQWPGLGGKWSVEQRTGTIDHHPYRFVLLQLATGNGTTATGLVAFVQRFHTTTQSMIGGVAGWAGYAIAAEVARTAGYPMAGQPPDHFKVTRRGEAGTTDRRRRIGLSDILRVGDQVDLGDGYTPTQRAENTLRLFLGEELYTQLERQHFLDVSSVCYASEKRIYRVRRDPAKQRERRVRVFKKGYYSNDFCIVRGQNVPEADHWLTVFLGLISDEEQTLSVVGTYNVFDPHSDDYIQREEEHIPAIWHPRAS
ncbi:MAG: hypothetical protein H0V70_20620 [Ktedonobacteraceae bacterium]|nr:hypothetical protein [Ktedonobacteraceae bacterium]